MDKDTSERDPLFEEAIEILKDYIKTNNLTTRQSIRTFKICLQRALCIGYNRADIIIQQLSDTGYIDPPKGWKINEDNRDEICNRKVFNPKICDIEFSGIDPLFKDAVRLIIKRNIASTSNIQRVFEIGYNRACKIIEQLEGAGIIGPAIGVKPREILLDKESLEKFLQDFKYKTWS